MGIVLTKIVHRTASNMAPIVILLEDDVVVLDKLDYYRLQNGVYVVLSNQTEPQFFRGLQIPLHLTPLHPTSCTQLLVYHSQMSKNNQ